MGKISSIMAIVQENRVETAVKVQDVLTKYGCNILVRLGIHDSNVGECTNSGMILLQLSGEDVIFSSLQAELREISKVKVKYMTLDF